MSKGKKIDFENGSYFSYLMGQAQLNEEGKGAFEKENVGTHLELVWIGFFMRKSSYF